MSQSVYQQEYERVDRFVRNGQPRSAKEIVDEVYERAVAAGDEDEMVRALAYRAAYLGELEEDGTDAAVRLLRTELEKYEETPVVNSLLHYLIGQTYYQFAERNSYRLRNNTAVTTDTLPSREVPLADWSLTQLAAAAKDHLSRALLLSRQQGTRVLALPAVVSDAGSRTAERPTLYDLLVRGTLETLQRPLVSYYNPTIENAADYLARAAAFVNLPVEGIDNDATREVIATYQQLINFHLAPAAPALLYADLERVEAVYRMGTGDLPYYRALERMSEDYAGVPGSDRILLRRAQLLTSSDLKGAVDRPRTLALSLLDQVRDTSRAVQLQVEQLREDITSPRLSARVEKVVERQRNVLIHTRYRNLPQVYLRLYPAPEIDQEILGYNGRDFRRNLLRRRPLAAKNFSLPAHADYDEQTTETWLPRQQAGRYVLVLSETASFDEEQGLVAFTTFQISGLAVTERAEEKGPQRLQAIDRTTGAPRSGVRVALERAERYGNDFKRWRTVTTGPDGLIDLPNNENVRFRMQLTDPATDDQLFVGGRRVYNNRNDRSNREREYVTLFTDRSIYRPGQTVRLYGLTYRLNAKRMPSLRTGANETLELFDANGQRVSGAEVISDEYGRFHTDFRLPAGGLTGAFSVRNDNGSVSFRVEEYKRPRFAVELTAPDYVVATEAATISGQAKLYAGPGVDNARVNYRVFLEEVSYFWWRQGGTRELVASGETTTDAEGKFELSFVPAAQRGRRRFRYVVEADVADGSGETHTGETTTGLRSEQPVVGLRPADQLIATADSLLLLASGSMETTEIRVTVTPVTKPDAADRERPWDFPDTLTMTAADYRRLFPELAATPETDLKDWPTSGAPVFQGTMTVAEGEAKRSLAAAGWAVGHYRVDFRYPDGTAGEPSTFAVYRREPAALPAGVATVLDAPARATVGEPLTITLLTAQPQANIFVSFDNRDEIKTSVVNSDGVARFPYLPTEADRGGIQFKLSFTRNGEMIRLQERIQLDWDNKELDVTYATFRDRLRPGQPEQWTLSVRNADGSPLAAAALAAMYDASLDQIARGQQWAFNPWPRNGQWVPVPDLLLRGTASALAQRINPPRVYEPVPPLPELDLPLVAGRRPQAVAYRSAAAPQVYEDAVMEEVAIESEAVEMKMSATPPPPPPPAGAVGGAVAEAPVQMRTDLQETALWLPDLTTAADGTLQIKFTTPEALTSWKFRLFVHDKELASAVSERTVVTQKELMVLPNVPRFVREGDRIELTARVNNLSEQPLDATVKLELFDPATDAVLTTEELSDLAGVGAGAGWMTKEQKLAAGAGASVGFSLRIPEDYSARGTLGYRIIARGGAYSDGEENAFPVLSDRTLITVSQPFYLKRGEKKTVELAGMADGASPSLRSVNYTFEATTNPAWLALKSLPYLMEYPYDCTEQIANRFFANQLAYATVKDKPILEQVFRAWEADSNALKSELQRNESLKNALLTETPWVREAQSEAEQRARIGQLFDLQRLSREQDESLAQLVNRQENGAFPWFPGGPANRYVTQYVVETTARLTQLGVLTQRQAVRLKAVNNGALNFLERELTEDYQRLVRDNSKQPEKLKTYRPSSTIVHFLYARALTGRSLPAADKQNPTATALRFYAERARAEWLSYGLYEQALLAITDVKDGDADKSLALRVVTSLREKALRKDEFGMYWKYGQGFRWQNLPIETHCRILEAFQVAGGTQEELDELRLWLLTNKRTNRWETTKSTAAAVYALLNTGTDWTNAPGEELEVEWKKADNRKALGRLVEAAQAEPEAATGAFSVSVAGEEVNADMAKVRVSNPSNRLVWGGVYWQYTEVAERVRAANDGPLTLERQLFRRVATPEGMRLEPLTAGEPLAPGDRVTVRLIVRSDRELDFVHLKDRRAATFEPSEQLSGYRYESGLGYYFAPGDLATNFFFDHLPRGTHTLEYDLFATYAGTFSNGLGRVQCMYAPEFGANTAGARITVAAR